MKPKTIILMVIAIACGLGASYMTSRLLAERGDAQEVPKVKVLVAKKDLALGTPLKEAKKLFVFKYFEEGQEPKEALVAYDGLKNKFLKRALRKGDFVTQEDLDDERTRLQIPDGHQAVGISVNMETVAGGFASLPGSRVDIHNIIRSGSASQSMVQLLLEDVLVLAADTTDTPGESKAMPASVVTVALIPEDAMKVNLAKKLGELTLTLRKPGDKSRSETTRLTARQVLTDSPSKNEESENPDGPQPEVPEPVSPTPPEIQPEQPKLANQDNNPEPVIPPEPEFKRHVVRIQEGDRTRTVVFLVDRDGNVIEDEIANQTREQTSQDGNQESADNPDRRRGGNNSSAPQSDEPDDPENPEG